MLLWTWGGESEFPPGFQVLFCCIFDLPISNGIRFSISDLSEPTARIMPTVFQDRAGISLYDAQFSTVDGKRGPIPATVIEHTVTRLLRFKTTCEDFEVPEQNIHVLATEATRTAPNCAEFISTVRQRTGWEIRMLSKEEEGRIGALGVASSFSSVEGLVMDLGGGSTQITWMVARDGVVTTSPSGSVSFPYGAAALLRKLEEVHRKGVPATENLKEEMKSNFRNAYKSLLVPEALEKAAASRGGFDLYLCGGGFRGWGYLLMSQSTLNPYPIPIINGFSVNWAEFSDTAAVSYAVSQGDTEIFRVSKRRASQVPAVAFLVKVVAEALPAIRSIQFCQGGVREGFLYDHLGEYSRKQDPLLVATAPYAPPSAKSIFDLLKSALPATMSPIISRQIPSTFTDTLLLALANLCYAHTFVPRENRPASSLYSTTTGILASATSLAHADRAILALILRERWPGDLAPAEQSFQSRLLRFVSPQEAWWCQYLGRVATLIGNVYPAGRVSNDRWRIRFNTRWQQVYKKKQGNTDALQLTVVVNEADQAVSRDSLQDAVERIEKLGKRKNWVKVENCLAPELIEEDYGVNIEVTVSSDASN
jgi:retrograde regulation protein 2